MRISTVWPLFMGNNNHSTVLMIDSILKVSKVITIVEDNIFLEVMPVMDPTNHHI